MNNWPSYLNIAGLLLDGIATIGLFFIVSASLQPINTIRVKISSTVHYDENKNLTDELENEINGIIDRYERDRKTERLKARKWFGLLVVGIVMQVIAAAIQAL